MSNEGLKGVLTLKPEKIKVKDELFILELLNGATEDSRGESRPGIKAELEFFFQTLPFFRLIMS
jgi:hypothetical protein